MRWVVALRFGRFPVQIPMMRSTGPWDPTLQRGSRWPLGRSRDCAVINIGWVRLPPRHLSRDSQRTFRKSHVSITIDFLSEIGMLCFIISKLFFEIKGSLPRTKTFSERQWIIYVNQETGEARLRIKSFSFDLNLVINPSAVNLLGVVT